MRSPIIKAFIVFLFLIFYAEIGRADLLMDLESGKFSELEKSTQDTTKKVDPVQDIYFHALNDFYRGNLKNANDLLLDVSTQTYVYSAWLKNYLNEVFPVYSGMEIFESPHFVLRTEKREKFLADYALDALEKAYQEIGKDLQIFPQEKVQVEIYSTQETFSNASTLSKETLDRSGAIGICKFRRLMILSPQQIAFGYRWLDTLAHEYSHYLINMLSAGKCPLWLHEGISKYIDTSWRLKDPHYLIPGNRTELVRAMKENQLIPFSKMEPSMVYLENQTQVRLAFSQVSHAVHYICYLKGQEAIRQILIELFFGKTRDDAFRSVLNLSSKEFEEKWKSFLEDEKLEESAGALSDRLKFGKQADELEEFVGTDIRGHIRLGDRFVQSGRLQVALIQYEKALKQETNNPVGLVKSAKILLKLGKEDEALERLERSIRENPNYSPAFLILSDQMIQKKDWHRALVLTLEANAINPFNPEIHQKLSKIYDELENADSSKKESDIFQFLTNSNQ